MTQMVYEVFDALKSINVSDEKATAVAKALGNQDAKLNEVKFELKEEIRELRSELKAQISKLDSEVSTRITKLDSGVTNRITKLESDLGAKIRLNTWMLGIVLVTQGIVLTAVIRLLSQ